MLNCKRSFDQARLGTDRGKTQKRRVSADHLRGLIKGTPSLSGVRIFCGTPGLEAWMPSLGEQVGTVKRGGLTDQVVAGNSMSEGKRSAAAAAAAAGAAAEAPALKRQALSSSGTERTASLKHTLSRVTARRTNSCITHKTWKPLKADLTRLRA